MALDADLVIDRLADRFVVALGNEFAPHRAFSLKAIEGGVPVSRRTIQVEVSNSASTVQTNATNYASGSGDNTNAAITVNEYSVSWKITSQEQLQGHRFATGPGRNAQALADTIWGVPAALLTAANYANSVTAVAEASFAAANRQALWASIKAGNQGIHLVLGRTGMSGQLPANKDSFELDEEGAYGFQGLHTATDWSAAEANVYGFASVPQAMLVEHGVPARPNVVNDAIRNTGRIETLAIPGGLEVELAVWVDTNTKDLWAGLAVCYGAVVGDGTALTLQKSA